MVVGFLLLFKRRWMVRSGQDAFATAYYRYDPGLLGRSHTDFPAPSCCAGASCVPPRAGGSGRVAVLSVLSTAEYLPLLLQLECTLRRSNPGVPLLVMATPGVLEPPQRRLLTKLDVRLVDVEPLEFRNVYEPRFSRNWVKLRAFNLTEFDALLVLDSDTVVPGDLSQLWQLPTAFAAVWDQQRWLGRHRATLSGINGGVLFLRPCPATASHMLDLLQRYPKLQFTHGTAEQDFLAWYFRYTGFMLPLEYNVQVSASLVGNKTVGGRDPVVLHFTANKPWRGQEPGVLGHDFLCDAETLRHRTLSAGMRAHGGR